MRMRGACLPWHSWAKPPAAPRCTWACETMPSQLRGAWAASGSSVSWRAAEDVVFMSPAWRRLMTALCQVCSAQAAHGAHADADQRQQAEPVGTGAHVHDDARVDAGIEQLHTHHALTGGVAER